MASGRSQTLDAFLISSLYKLTVDAAPAEILLVNEQCCHEGVGMGLGLLPADDAALVVVRVDIPPLFGRGRGQQAVVGEIASLIEAIMQLPATENVLLILLLYMVESALI